MPVVISEFDPKDAGDFAALKKISEEWKGADYIKNILISFNRSAKYYQTEGNIPDKYKYYAVEIPNNEPLHKKTLGLISIFSNPSNSLEIDHLQVKPDLKHQKDKTRKIKGIGEMLVGKVFEVANTNRSKISEIGLIPSTGAQDFYEKMFQKADIQNKGQWEEFVIDSSDFPKFLKYIEYKYQTKFKKY